MCCEAAGLSPGPGPPSGTASKNRAVLSRVSRRPCRFHAWFPSRASEDSSACEQSSPPFLLPSSCHVSMSRSPHQVWRPDAGQRHGRVCRDILRADDIAHVAGAIPAHLLALRRWPLLSERFAAELLAAPQQERRSRHAGDAAAQGQLLRHLQSNVMQSSQKLTSALHLRITCGRLCRQYRHGLFRTKRSTFRNDKLPLQFLACGNKWNCSDLGWTGRALRAVLHVELQGQR